MTDKVQKVPSISTETISVDDDLKFVEAIKDYEAKQSDHLSFKKGDHITITKLDGMGFAEGKLGDETGWFPLEFVEKTMTPRTKEMLSPRERLNEMINRQSLLNPEEKVTRRSSLTVFLKERPLREQLVKKKILPSAEATKQLEIAQKLLLKEKKKKKQSKNIVDRIIESKEKSNCSKEFEFSLDECIVSCLTIPTDKHHYHITTTFEDAFLGSQLTQHFQTNETCKSILRITNAADAKAKAQTWLDRNIIVGPTEKFSSKHPYQLQISKTSYGVLNVNKIWKGPTQNGYDLSVELMEQIVKLMLKYLPDFEALRKSKKLYLFGLKLSQLQKADFHGMSKIKKKVCHINLYNMMILYTHARFSPPTSMIERKYLSEECKLLIANLVFTPQGLEQRALKEGQGKDWMLYFCLSDCTISTPATFLYKEDNFSDTQRHATQHFLKNRVELDPSNYEIQLPRVLQRISKDLGKSHSELIELVAPLLPSKQSKEITKMKTVGTIDVKFAPTAFEPSYIFEDIEQEEGKKEEEA